MMRLDNLEKAVLLVVASLAIATCTAPAGTYVDKWPLGKDKNGKPTCVLVIYDLDAHVAHLIMPSGRDLTVAYDPLIEKGVLDAGLHRIINQDQEATR
jgi:hypothetical protein